jgi:hypothetical protein
LPGWGIVAGFGGNGLNCSKCTELGCVVCDKSISKCEGCGNGYYDSDGSIPTSKKCSKCSENCLRCYRREACLECESGYSVSSGEYCTKKKNLGLIIGLAVGGGLLFFLIIIIGCTYYRK